MKEHWLWIFGVGFYIMHFVFLLLGDKGIISNTIAMTCVVLALICGTYFLVELLRRNP